MSQELERVYTIPLGKVLLSPNNIRAKRAINMIREFARHHMKTEVIKIEEDVAHQIWSRGIKHPPRKIRVRMSKTDEGFILVSKYEEDVEPEVKPAKEEKPSLEEKATEEVSPETEKEIEASEVKEIEDKVEAKPSKEKPKAKQAKEKPKAKQAKEKPKAKPSKEKPKAKKSDKK